MKFFDFSRSAATIESQLGALHIGHFDSPSLRRLPDSDAFRKENL